MRRLQQDEEGAFIVVWALLLVALLAMVAIVIDLGRLRDTKRDAQRTADLAALAAGRKLAGVLTASNTLFVSSQGACADAFEYIKANIPDLPPTASMSGATGCPSLPSSCVNDDPAATPPAVGTAAVNAVATGADPYAVTVRYPVADAEIVDPRYTEPRPSDGKMCERMRISISRGNATYFAGVIGVSDLATTASTVVRGFGKPEGVRVPSLTLLERVGCGVLFTQSASPSSKLTLSAVSPDNPGIIHADSFGVPNQGTCDATAAPPEQVTDKIVFGKAMTDNTASIITQDCLYTPPATTCSATGTETTKGLLSLNALRVGSPFGAYQLATTCPDPTCGIQSTLVPGDVVSRRIVDAKYLDKVKDLKMSSDTLLNMANDLTPGGGRDTLLADPAVGGYGYKLYPDFFSVACGALPAGLTEILEAKVLVKEDCDLNPVSSSLLFTGTDFIVAGKINVGSGKTLSFPNATQMLIAGCATTVTASGGTSTCGSATAGTNVGVNIGGTFLVNARTAATGSCPADPTLYDPSVVVLRTGRLDTSTSSTFTLCQVFLYMSGMSPATDGISQSVSATDHSSCAPPPLTTPPTPATPCPIDTPDYRAFLNIQGTITWLAPNQSPLTPRNPADINQKFEDIAFWSEGSRKSSLKGTGATNTTGLFFFPNALFEFQGQSCTTPRDAQFFSRRLELSGTSCFIMKPLPQNAVFIPSATFTLIR